MGFEPADSNLGSGSIITPMIFLPFSFQISHNIFITKNLKNLGILPGNRTETFLREFRSSVEQNMRQLFLIRIHFKSRH